MGVDATIASPARIEVHGGTLRTAGAGQVDVGSEVVVLGRNPGCDLVLDDGKVSAIHADVVGTSRGVRVRDLGSRNGTFIGEARIVEAYLTRHTVLTLGGSRVEFTPAPPREVDVPDATGFGPLAGQSAAMRAVYERLRKTAATDLTVLVTGETGTGKELVAQAIHEASSRSHKPFVVVDCSAIPPTLAETALFGHERGAFTGAVERRISPFVEADGGTLFLDELGELPIEVQPKLLRVLAERRVKSVGSSTYRPVNVRIIAATRRDLMREVNAGAFRSDLYFRVAQIRVELPPLRQRLEDIPVLVRRMVADLADEATCERICPASLERLLRYDWPGNVRELRNVVAVALAFGDEGPIDLAANLSPIDGTRASSPFSEVEGTRRRTFQDAKRDVLTHFERDYFAELYVACGGNISEVARRSGMERAHVRGYLRRHGIGDTSRARLADGAP
jgi:DNA-binding NtrC family response regulator